jgi:hypothetical protein
MLENQGDGGRDAEGLRIPEDAARGLHAKEARAAQAAAIAAGDGGTTDHDSTLREGSSLTLSRGPVKWPADAERGVMHNVTIYISIV